MTLLATGEIHQALMVSLQVAVVATLLVLLPGTLCGLLLARHDFRGKGLVDGLLHLPLVLPPVATGYLLLVVLGRRGIIGGLLHEYLGISLSFNWFGAVLASALVAFPLMVRAARTALEMLDVRLDQAAQTLGAGRVDVFVSIILPQALPGLIAGAILAFARSLGEFGATVVFAGNVAGETRTLPLALYTAIQQPEGDRTAATVMLLSVTLAVLATLASEWLNRRISRRGGTAS